MHPSTGSDGVRPAEHGQDSRVAEDNEMAHIPRYGRKSSRKGRNDREKHPAADPDRMKGEGRKYKTGVIPPQ